MSDTPLERPRVIRAAGRAFAIEIARHPRARRYVLRMTSRGSLRLTVPRRASIAGGLAFAGRQHEWIVREWTRLERRSAAWTHGTDIWYRGSRVPLVVGERSIGMADVALPIRADVDIDIRHAVEARLREMAAAELPGRLATLAAERGIAGGTVTVRNQRTRWGSCSIRGSIALNWRLIQMPLEVCDYIILHEIAHRRHPNHSARFWREVEALCPWWRPAERWLRKHGGDLL